MQVIKISIYLFAFTVANLIVLYFGPKGLLFTALFLIPFDFVMRCVFHETWKGWELILKLGLIVVAAGIITYIINKDSLYIALGSIAGFTSAQIVAGIFYQLMIKKNYFIKVNGSDLIGIIADSIIFQIVAFGIINSAITIEQVILKAIGGLFWYYIIFEKLQLHKKLLK